MSWKEKRIVKVLCAILGALSAALLLVSSVYYRRAQETDRQGQEEEETQSVENIAASPDDGYHALSYDNGSVTLSFSMDEEEKHWIWADDPTFPLDDTTVVSIVNLLENWDPQRTITDGDTLESYGLADPSATLTAAGAHETLTLAFGKAVAEGGGRYVLMNGDESTVYVVTDTLYEALSVPVYDMMDLPEFPVLTEETLSSVILEGPQISTTIQAKRDGGAVTWHSGGADVTDHETVQALLGDFAVMCVEKCIGYTPSDEALEICGFHAPSAVVTFFYDGETESPLVLTVGERDLGNSGRYVQLGEADTVYLMRSAFLDPLMRVAANGLD